MALSKSTSAFKFRYGDFWALPYRCICFNSFFCTLDAVARKNTLPRDH